MKCRRSEKGPSMTVAYERIRVAPSGALAKELLSLTLENEMKNGPKIGRNTDIEDDEYTASKRNNHNFSTILSTNVTEIRRRILENYQSMVFQSENCKSTWDRMSRKRLMKCSKLLGRNK